MITRIMLVIITIFGVIIAIFKVVSFARAGFGATFGPIILFSLFWKKTTTAGAIAGMLAGGSSVFIWSLLISKLGGIFAIYELLPSFLISCIVIYTVPKFTTAPSKGILENFEKAKSLSV